MIGGGKTSADQPALFDSGLVRYVDLLDSYLAPGGLCHPSDNFAPFSPRLSKQGHPARSSMLALGSGGLFEGPDGLERMLGLPILADWMTPRSKSSPRRC